MKGYFHFPEYSGSEQNFRSFFRNDSNHFSFQSTEFLNYLHQFLPKETTDQTIIDAWNAMLLDLPERRIQFLAELRKTHPLFLFSNTNEIHFKNFTNYFNNTFGDPALLDKIFAQTYFSHLVKKRKPNADAFLQVINDHGLDPSTTLFVDDSLQHIEGARKVGLLTKHLVSEDIIDIFDHANL